MKTGRIGLSLLAAVFILAGLSWLLSFDIPIAQSQSDANYHGSATAIPMYGSTATGFVSTSQNIEAPGTNEESTSSSSNTIIYVDVDSTSRQPDILDRCLYQFQDALTTVISGTEIWVAEGVYYPDVGGAD